MTFGVHPNRDGADNGSAPACGSRTNSPQNLQPSDDRNFHGDPRNNTARRSQRKDHGDWLLEQAQKRSRSEIANASGLSLRGAENIRLGESKIGFDALTEWLMNDPLLRAHYFAYVGGRLEASPEMYAYMNQAFNTWMVHTQKGMAD